MQKYKKQFSDTSFCQSTLSNIQSCLRLDDLSVLGDGSHFGHFHMLGLFSFRDWDVEKGVRFWLEFVEFILNLKISHVTIHPDKEVWREFYPHWEVKLDQGCRWTDGQIGGYCTEFYVGDLEIGNIVNPLGTCLDVGFGLERLDGLVNGFVYKSKKELLSETIIKIIESGVKPSNVKQGYVLRKLLRTLVKEGGSLDHEFFKLEQERQQKTLERYHRLKTSYPNQTKEWWFDTHGIDLAVVV